MVLLSLNNIKQVRGSNAKAVPAASSVKKRKIRYVKYIKLNVLTI